MSERVIQNWVRLADYDLETAKAMLDAARYLYVAFTCQQAAEKMLKGIFVKENHETPPYTHNLLRLLDGLSIRDVMDEEQKRFMEMLNSYYLESRYTEELAELSKVLTRKKCEEVYSNTEGLVAWLKTKLQ